jgi:haloacetate dehalogenase
MIDALDSFQAVTLDHKGIRIAAWSAGTGEPVLLLHGYPESHLMWHRVAAELARTYTVVLADLRGYGRSDRPPDDPAHRMYSKREMALDQIALMNQLGHEAFAVVGHDRGGRVAHRLALDHPSRVSAVAVLDIVPTRHMFTHVDRTMADAYFHWFFLSRPAPLPEQLIEGNLELWMRSRYDGRHFAGEPFDRAVFAEHVAAMRRPGAVAATCADYRAAASTDLEHDHEDWDHGRLVEAPLLALWGRHGFVGRSFDVLDVWRHYAHDVRGHAIESDHYLAEEAPAPTLSALRAFLQDVSR